MIQPSEPDVVSPAVAADRPDALGHEVIGQRVEPPCIGVVDRGEHRAKRYDLAFSGQQSKLAVDSGQWPLYRFDPARTKSGEAPLQLDMGPPTASPIAYMRNEARFRMAEMVDPARFKHMLSSAAAHTAHRVAIYQQLAGIKVDADVRPLPPPPEPVTTEKE